MVRKVADMPNFWMILVFVVILVAGLKKAKRTRGLQKVAEDRGEKSS